MHTPFYSLLIMLLFTTYAATATEFSKEGGYGFDWLKPETTRCKVITQKDITTFKKCEYITTATFGLPIASYKCDVNKHSEYFILQTKAECIDALETMQANAP